MTKWPADQVQTNADIVRSVMRVLDELPDDTADATIINALFTCLGIVTTAMCQEHRDEIFAKLAENLPALKAHADKVTRKKDREALQ
jgi:hypothetical protein